MWAGYTQTGKSSSIKLLTGDNSIICGEYGVGKSTTNTINIYKEIQSKLIKPYLHCDTIGLGDNTMLYDNQAIRENIQINILKLTKPTSVLGCFSKVKAIIVTESFVGDSLRLPNVLTELKNIFKVLPKESILVLGTKRNETPNNTYA